MKALSFRKYLAKYDKRSKGSAPPNKKLTHPEKLNPLLKDNIIERIFTYASNNNLLNYRFVCSKWDKFCINTIKKRSTNNFQITFKIDESLKRFNRVFKEYHDNLIVKRFAFSKMFFEWPINEETVEEFFTICTDIQRLELIKPKNSSSIISLQNWLFFINAGQTLIELKLSLEEFDLQPNILLQLQGNADEKLSKNSEKEKLFPKLSHLSLEIFGNQTPINLFREIVKNAPNFSSLSIKTEEYEEENHFTLLINELKELGMIENLKKLKFNQRNQNEIGLLNKLNEENNLRLNLFHIELQYYDGLKTFLISQINTLQNISVNCYDFNATLSKLHLFSSDHLKVLKIKSADIFFSPELGNFSKLTYKSQFPNLEELNIQPQKKMNKKMLKNIAKLFINFEQEVAENVLQLTISLDLLETSSFKKLADIFPNVKILKVFLGFDKYKKLEISRELWGLWNLSLEELEIQNQKVKFESSLDRIFTFATQVHLDIFPEIKNINTLKELSPILNSKRLRKITIAGFTKYEARFTDIVASLTFSKIKRLETILISKYLHSFSQEVIIKMRKKIGNVFIENNLKYLKDNNFGNFETEHSNEDSSDSEDNSSASDITNMDDLNRISLSDSQSEFDEDESDDRVENEL